ncbi:MAG: hypothetical protein GWN58_53200 [Anaerolineae bacterium]|nr:hypothetical protein [Anaerolineae bacterium]
MKCQFLVAFFVCRARIKLEELTMSEQEQGKPPALGARRHRPECLCKMCTRIREAWAKGQERRAQGKPVRVSATQMKQQRFVQAILDTDNPETFGSPANAALAAGYAASTGKQLLNQPQVKSTLLAAMERTGITEKFLAQRLKEGLLATETKFFHHQGHVVEQREVIDYHGRVKFQEIAHRLRGDLQQEAPQAQAALILRLPERQTPEEWQADAEKWNQEQEAKRLREQEEAGRAEQDKPAEPTDPSND